MNAQEKWKIAYSRWLECHHPSPWNAMDRYRREALLERKLVAAQRAIDQLCGAERSTRHPDRDACVIRIIVEGGMVEDIENLPVGWDYEVDDRDERKDKDEASE